MGVKEEQKEETSPPRPAVLRLLADRAVGHESQAAIRSEGWKSIRCLSKATPARPSACRFSSVRRWRKPSVGPLLHARVSPACTADSSLCRWRAHACSSGSPCCSTSSSHPAADILGLDAAYDKRPPLGLPCEPATRRLGSAAPTGCRAQLYFRLKHLGRLVQHSRLSTDKGSDIFSFSKKRSDEECSQTGLLLR